MLWRTFSYQLLGVSVQFVNQQFRVIMHTRRLAVTVKSTKLRLAGIARPDTEEYILLTKPVGRRPLGRPRERPEFLHIKG